MKTAEEYDNQQISRWSRLSSSVKTKGDHQQKEETGVILLVQTVPMTKKITPTIAKPERHSPLLPVEKRREEQRTDSGSSDGSFAIARLKGSSVRLPKTCTDVHQSCPDLQNIASGIVKVDMNSRSIRDHGGQ